MASQGQLLSAILGFVFVTAITADSSCPSGNPTTLKQPTCGALPDPGLEVNVQCHWHRYCETFEVVSSNPLTAIIWNTLGCSTCPDAQWNQYWQELEEWSSTTWVLLLSSIAGILGLVVWKVRFENDLGVLGFAVLVLLVLWGIAPAVSQSASASIAVHNLKNGPRHWWIDNIVLTMPEPDALNGDGRIRIAAFNNIGHNYVATLSQPPRPFTPIAVSRSTLWKFRAGRQVYMVKVPGPDGGEERYVMQSFHLGFLKVHDLLGLKERLGLPDGYDYECKVVGANGLLMEAADGTAYVMQDAFETTYMKLVDPDGCWPFTNETCQQETDQTMEAYRNASCGSSVTTEGVVSFI